MSRLTNNDRNFGPFTWGPWTNTFSLMWGSGGDEENGSEGYRNHLRVIAFGWVLQIKMPNIIKPLMEKVVAGWDEETVKRLGRNWYYNVWRKEYGFSLSNMGNGYDFLQVHFGPQTHDSSTAKSWCKHLPWKQWRCVRSSVYTPDGEHFASEDMRGGKFSEFMRQCEECPKSYFGFEDYDGELIIATTHIEEREWQKGEGWFKWLRFFNKPMIRRSLDLCFSAEVGPEKGSWKGGTLGHGIDMLPGETPEQAFRRYCEKGYEARKRGKTYPLRFIGPCGPPPPKPKYRENASDTESSNCCKA